MPAKVVQRPTPKGHGQPKGGAKRKDEGKKIVVRLSDEQHRTLLQAAGDRPISDYVRSKVSGGRPETGERSRDIYRKVAALHLLGRRLADASARPDMPKEEIDSLLADVRSAISGLAAGTLAKSR